MLLKYWPLIAFLCFQGCALSPVEKIKQEKKHDEISADSIIELARSSYVKGCIDGMNVIKKKRTKGERLRICVLKAKEHKAQLSKMLITEDSK